MLLFIFTFLDELYKQIIATGILFIIVVLSIYVFDNYNTKLKIISCMFKLQNIYQKNLEDIDAEILKK